MAEKTVAIIGARLGSSRLPGKQLLPLCGKPLLTHTVERLRSVAAIDQVILATTNSETNIPLVDWAHEANVHAFAWDGDENDLMGRVDAAFKESGADRFVYVCGDCALIHPDTITKLIDASIEAGQTGFAGLAPLLAGKAYLHEGFDVYNLGFWNAMMEKAKNPFEREHVGAVYHHMKKVEPAKLVHVHDDPIFSSVSHRLSVDTRRDYHFMRRIYEDWYKGHADDSLVDLKWVARKLQSDPALVSINSIVHQKAADEVPLNVAILCETGPSIGLGHLSRACVAAAALQDHLGAVVKIYIRGEKTQFMDLNLLPHEWVEGFDAQHCHADVTAVDVKALDTETKTLLAQAKTHSKIVGIDILRDTSSLFDLAWMPSVYVDPVSQRRLGQKLRYGPDCFLLRDTFCATEKQNDVKRVIILSGGSDPAKLFAFLPQKLDAGLDPEVQIDWVQGPFADAPSLRQISRDSFNILQAPTNLPDLLGGYDAAFCVYGVSFYECMKAGLQTVAVDPINAAIPPEWDYLKSILPHFIWDDYDGAVQQLNLFALNVISAPNAISGPLQFGSQNFADAIANLMSNKEQVAAQ